jgi:HEAT repeat protein
MAANKGTQPLIDALKDNDVDVRLMAAWALARVERREAGRSATALVEILRTETGVSRTAAIEALAELGPAARSALEMLRTRLKDSDPATRLSAAIALYAIDSKTADNEAVPALIAGLKDTNAEIRLAASEALKQIGPAAKAAVPVLLADLKMPGGSYAQYAATLDTVAKIGEPSVVALATILREAPLDPALARAVVECLGKIGPPAKAAVPVLVDILRDHRNVLLHRFVVAALGKIGPDALSTLRPLLTDSDSRVQILAIQAIGEMGSDAKAMAGELRKLKGANAASNFTAAIDAALKRIDPIGSP